MLSKLDTATQPQQEQAAPQFAITCQELDENTNVISVEGELDLTTAPRLKWMLLDSLQEGRKQLVVDLSLTGFMDSTALGVLVVVNRRLGEQARMAIVCSRSAVLKIFELSGMDGAFAIFPRTRRRSPTSRGSQLERDDRAAPVSTSAKSPTPLPRSRGALLVGLLGCALLTAGIPAATARTSHERGASSASEPSAPAASEPSSRAQPDAPRAAKKQRPERNRLRPAPPSPTRATGAPGRASPPPAKGARRAQKRAPRPPPLEALAPSATRAAMDRAPARGRAAGVRNAGLAAPRATPAALKPPAAPNPRRGRSANRGARPPNATSANAPQNPAVRTSGGEGQENRIPAPSDPGQRTGRRRRRLHRHPTATSASATVTAPIVAASGLSPLAAKASLATGAAVIARRAPRAASVKPRRPTRSQARGARAASTAKAPTSALATPVPASSAARSSRPRAAVKRTAAPVRSSPLATTITRIVGVVPTPIRILIGVLVALALAMAARSRLAARRARRLEQQRGELLEDVGLLQAALLPLTPARLGPVGTSAAYRPAAGPAAGGDFYDVFALEDGKLAVILGDVSGHGRKALPHTALVRFTLRAYLEAGLSPRGAVQTAGTVLDRQLGGSFATVVAATYDPRERLLVYASAGHPPPIVRGCQPDSQPIEPITVSSAPPVGVGMPTGVRQSVIAVPGCAQICFFTDGVTEARVAGELYGAERLAAALAELGPQASADELLDHVSREADQRPDDMAACLLHVEGSEEPPYALVEELELTREQGASARTERFLRACGVAPAQAEQLMRSARLATERSGSAVLALRRGSGAPEVSVQQDNLAYLQTRHAMRQADLRMPV